MKYFKGIIFYSSLFLILFYQLKLDYYSILAIFIFSFYSLKLIFNCNNYFPIIEIFLCLYGLQYLIGPVIIYNNEDLVPESYKMRISSDSYFSFIIPVYLSLSLGLNTFIKSEKLKINLDTINQFYEQNKKLPYLLITFGIFFSFIISFIPSTFQFIVYLFSLLKFIGLFILILSKTSTSNKIIFIIYGLIFVDSFARGVFHDLLIWIIFLLLILCLKYKPKLKFKFIIILLCLSLGILLESIKGAMRLRTWFGNETMSIGLLVSVIKDVNEDRDGLYNIQNLPVLAIRINQGWLVSLVMENVPSIVRHTDGKLINLYMQSAFLPRFLRKFKLMSGNQEIFTKYTGKDLNEGTVMVLGLFSDAYIDFGRYGAVIFIFIFGSFHSYILKQFFINSNKYPILILFVMISFYYSIRPDNDTQTSLAHLFKSIFLIYIGFKIYKNRLILKTN